MFVPHYVRQFEHATYRWPSRKGNTRTKQTNKGPGFRVFFSPGLQYSMLTLLCVILSKGYCSNWARRLCLSAILLTDEFFTRDSHTPHSGAVTCHVTVAAPLCGVWLEIVSDHVVQYHNSFVLTFWFRQRSESSLLYFTFFLYAVVSDCWLLFWWCCCCFCCCCRHRCCLVRVKLLLGFKIQT